MARRFATLIFTLLLFAGAVHASAQPGAQESCPATMPTTDLPPEPNTASWSSVWYRSDDGELWADAGRRIADGTKVLWRKPSGSTLTVSGHRLDGDAPPLEAEIPDGYPGAYQASGLIFPTGGCWEVEARAGDSTLTFVNYVYPKAFASPQGQNACQQLPAMVDASTLIFTGTAEGSYPLLGDDFALQTVRVDRVWKGALRRGERIDLLWDVTYMPALPLGDS